MSRTLEITANFRQGAVLPSIENHYGALWEIAKFLETSGIPLDEWFPPADTEENALLNKAFTDTGPSTAALALARADKDNHATDLRSLGVWNGKEDDGGIVYSITYDTGRIPSVFRFSSEEVVPLSDYRNTARFVQNLATLLKPMVMQIRPSEYADKRVFPNRPGAGWMLYLPFDIDARQIPEAAAVIEVMDQKGKNRQGSLIVTVAETFNVQNSEHIKKANAIETRLVDQDLLPTNSEFVAKF
jgi:hypothetical protein